MKILILGGNGFIGSYLTKKLLEEYHFIRILDKVEPENRHPEVDYFIGDWNNESLIYKSLIDIELVFHLVSTSTPSTANINIPKDIENNLISTVKFLQCMLQMRVKKIVFFSSGGTIYGKSLKLPVSESHEISPISAYGVIKASIELYLSMFKELNGLEVMILRPSNIYGERKSLHGVHGFISTALNNLKINKPIVIWGDGSAIRDYIYIDDLTNFCLLLTKQFVTGTYNIGFGVGYSLNEVIDLMFTITKRRVSIIYDNPRIFDIKEIVLDVEKIKNTFNWKPSVALENGIIKTWSKYINY
jgi:UDP-glucose 4-epimerase